MRKDDLPIFSEIYELPRKYKFDHSNVALIRFELRQFLLNEICGDMPSVLFGDAPLESRITKPAEEWLPNSKGSSHSHTGRPCARKLVKGEPTHRCLTCGLDDTCVLCKYCYNPAEHVGHNVFVKISSRDDGGICDCGDSEAWKCQLHCFSDDGIQYTEELPEKFKERALKVCNIMLDFIVDVFSGVEVAENNVPDFEHAFNWWLDCQPTPFLRGYENFEDPNNMWCLVLYDDDRKSLMDLHATVEMITERGQNFLKIIEKRVQKSGRAVIAIDKNPHSLLAKASRSDMFPLVLKPVLGVIWEEMAEEMVFLLYDLTQCSLNKYESSSFVKIIGKALLQSWTPGVAPHSQSPASYINLREALSDLNQYSIPDAHEEKKRLLVFDNNYDKFTGKWLILPDYELFGDLEYVAKSDKVLADELQSDVDVLMMDDDLLCAATDTRHKNWPLQSGKSHVMFLMFFDVKLNKMMRQKLIDLYVAALVSNPELKMEFSRVYGDLFPVLVRHHALIDKHPYIGVTTELSPQLFTTPSVATMLMENAGFEVYIDTLYDLFTKNDRLDAEMFRNRRLGQTFLEVISLLMRNTRREIVGGSSLRLVKMAKFLSAFQGIAPLRRERHEHVLYESDRWIYWFTTIPFVLQLAKSVAIGIQDISEDDEVPVGVRKIARNLAGWCRSLHDFHEIELFTVTIEYGNLKVSDLEYGIYDAEDEALSMINPTHAFLGWLLQYSRIESTARLRDTLWLRSPADGIYLFEPCMNTLAMLSQISAGLWVRNGYTTKYQLNCYRETMLRDLAYCQDVIMTQIAFCAMNPNAAFYNLIDKFYISEWPKFKLGDELQSYYMLDEFLHCLTALFCDRVRLAGFDSQEEKELIMIQEIVQVLWFGPLPYSVITSRLPENIASEELFDIVLERITEFSMPSGTHGVGTYTLKKNRLRLFDPQFTYFNLSKIEEAERIMESKDSPFSGDNESVHFPALFELRGPWARLPLFTRCVAFARFMHNVLVTIVNSDSSQAEQSLGRVLYLLIIAAHEEVGTPLNESVTDDGCFASVAELIKAPPNGTEDNASENNDDKNSSILDILYSLTKGERKEKFHSQLPKVHKLLYFLHSKDKSIVYEPLGGNTTETTSQEQVKRKAKAKEMQAKILADFHHQQQQFMDSNQFDAEAVAEDGAPSDMDLDISGYTFQKHCVLCRMTGDADSICGILTYTSQQSIRRSLPSDPYWLKEGYKDGPNLDVEHPLPEPANGSNSSDGVCGACGPAFPVDHIERKIAVQGCGHSVHFDCFIGHLSGQIQNADNVTTFSAENLVTGEFLCPLCRAVNDSFLPILTNYNMLAVSDLFELDESQTDLYSLPRILGDPDLEIDTDEIIDRNTPAMNDDGDWFRDNILNMEDDDVESLAFKVETTLLDQMVKFYKKSNKGDGFDALYIRRVYEAFGATLENLEISMRGQKHSTPFGGVILDQLNPRTVEFIRAFAQYTRSITCLVCSHHLSDEYFTYNNKSPLEVLRNDRDFLSTLIELTIFYCPGYGIPEKLALKVSVIKMIMHIAKNAEKYNFSSEIIEPAKNSDPRIASQLQKWSKLDPAIVYGVIEHQMTIVYRRFALLIFSFCGSYDSEDYCGTMHLPEHERLCRYLELFTFPEMLISMSDPKSLEFKIANGLEEQVFSQPNRPEQLLDYPGMYELLKLPYNLESLFNVPDRPGSSNTAICLICGSVCGVQEYDLSAGEPGPCNLHLRKCSIDQGIFFLPRRNFILLLRSGGRGTFIPAPYLDSHGETDESMRRGRPHFLQPARYAEFTRDVYLKNGLPSLVSRRLDQSQDHGGWETL